MKTYKAMQVAVPGTLELVNREVQKPNHDEVLIAVEACGICGADIGDIEGADPLRQLPRVPGHEVVGRIIARGHAVPDIWKMNQRVGIGRLGGHCNTCVQCRQGRFELCRNQPFVGSSCDGGYAEMMVARATGLVAIPDELDSEEAAPILCAGIATFNALKKCGAEAGDLVAVFGIGGLGHMAIQYARKMGFKVAAIGRGENVSEHALRLGAHIYIDSDHEAVAERLNALGGAKAMIVTVANATIVSTHMSGLAPGGRLVVLGGGKDPLSISPGALVSGERSVLGSITGTPYENERTLDLSVLSGVRPMIETMPLEKAIEAYNRMRSGDVTFRMVLTMENNHHAHS